MYKCSSSKGDFKYKNRCMHNLLSIIIHLYIMIVRCMLNFIHTYINLISVLHWQYILKLSQKVTFNHKITKFIKTFSVKQKMHVIVIMHHDFHYICTLHLHGLCMRITPTLLYGIYHVASAVCRIAIRCIYHIKSEATISKSLISACTEI